MSLLTMFPTPSLFSTSLPSPLSRLCCISKFRFVPTLSFSRRSRNDGISLAAVNFGLGFGLHGTKHDVGRRVMIQAEGGQGGAAVVVEGPSSSSSDRDDATAGWEAFGAQVSGEWDGYSAEFNWQGEPVQLPSNVVPDAFREWGVEVHDWQTQCPTLAHPEKGQLWYKVIRLLPTVGCEADAATTHSVEECDAQQNASTLAYHNGGSYTTVWRGKRVTNEKKGSGPGKVISREGDELEVEQCLVHERTRVRVLQQLGARRRILVFREIWEGPFRNGESLGGCAATTSAFATQPHLQASALTGSWRADRFSAEGSSEQDMYASSELTSSGSEDVERQIEDETLLLPKDMWTMLKTSNSGGSIVETGWLVQPDQALVSICEFESSGELKGVHLRLEKRASGA